MNKQLSNQQHRKLAGIIFILLNMAQFSFAQLHTEVTYPSKDGLLITADLYMTDKDAPTLLLFHQSVSSRGEYRTIAPKLLAEGFNCLAVDLRWGKTDFWNGIPNETAKRNGTYEIVTQYEDTKEYQLNKVWPVIFKAYDDMVASLEYLIQEGFHGQKIVMGSSFSAMLVFQLAAHQKEVDGVIAFSPGEYHPVQDSLLHGWSKAIQIPVYIGAGKGQEELEMAQKTYTNLPQHTFKKFHQSKGRHGASVLIDQEQDWVPLLAFLNLFKPIPVKENITFTTIELFRTRTNSDTTTKQIPVHVWFPSSDSLPQQSSQLTYQNYVDNLKTENSASENIALFGRIINSFGNNSLTERQETLEEFLQTPISAFKFSGVYPDKKYPLVIISGAHPIYHTELAESIASNGFVVAAIPRLGKNPGERLPFNVEGASEFQQDLRYVISSLSRLNWIDAEQLSFIAWSFEGVPVLETAMSNPKTDLVISFDASLGYEYGSGLIQDSIKFYKGDFEFLVLHYTGSTTDFGKDLTLLQKLKKDTNRIKIDESYELLHSEFTSLGALTINQKPVLYYKSLQATILSLLANTFK